MGFAARGGWKRPDRWTDVRGAGRHGVAAAVPRVHGCLSYTSALLRITFPQLTHLCCHS